MVRHVSPDVPTVLATSTRHDLLNRLRGEFMEEAGLRLTAEHVQSSSASGESRPWYRHACPEGAVRDRFQKSAE